MNIGEIETKLDSPLQGALALACVNRYAGVQHVARNPCFTPRGNDDK